MQNIKLKGTPQQSYHVHTEDCNHDHEQEENPINLLLAINLCVKKESKPCCYSCNKNFEALEVLIRENLLDPKHSDNIFINFAPFLRNKIESVEAQSTEKKHIKVDNVKIYQEYFAYINKNNKCSHCGARLLLNMDFPLNNSNQIEGVERYRISSQNVDALTGKLNFLINYYRSKVLMDKFKELNEQKPRKQNLYLEFEDIERSIKRYAKKFPFYYVFDIDKNPIDEQHYIKFFGINLFMESASEKGVVSKSVDEVKNFCKHYEQIDKTNLTPESQTIVLDLENKKYDSLYEKYDTDYNFIDFKNIELEKYQKYFFLDIDGTSSCKELKKQSKTRHKLSFFFHKFLSLLQRDKILKTIITTGRPFEWAQIYGSDIGLSAPYICSGGYSCVYTGRPKTGEQAFRRQYHQKIDTNEIAKKIQKILKLKYALDIDFWFDNTNMLVARFIDRDSIANVKGLQQLINADSEIISELQSFGPNSEILLEDNEDGMVVLKLKNWGKGRAILKLAKALNIEKKDLISAGNHYNDLDVVEVVGHSIGPSNALESYREKCTDKSDLSEARGVLECLKKILLNEVDSETKQPIMTEALWAKYMKETEAQFKNDIEAHTFL